MNYQVNVVWKLYKAFLCFGKVWPGRCEDLRLRSQKKKSWRDTEEKQETKTKREKIRYFEKKNAGSCRCHERLHFPGDACARGGYTQRPACLRPGEITGSQTFLFYYY